MATVSDLFIAGPSLQGGKGIAYSLTGPRVAVGLDTDRPSERVDAGQSTEQRREVLCTIYCV